MMRWMKPQLKRSFRNAGVITVAVLALLLYLLIGSVSSKRQEERGFGLLAQDGVCAGLIARELSQDQNSAFTPMRMP